MTGRRSSPWVAACLLVLAVLGVALVGHADAKVPIYSLSSTTSTTKAGDHPNISVTIEVGTKVTESPSLPCFCNAVRDITVNTPAGLVATPANLPQCKAAEFSAEICPTDSQVGVVAARVFAPLDLGGLYAFQPLYNMEARKGQLALFATPAPVVRTPIYIAVSARTESDYGLEFRTFGLPAVIDTNEVTQIIWGVPADPVHDALRFPFTSELQSIGSPLAKSITCGNINGVNPVPDLLANRFPVGCHIASRDPVPSNSPVVPFVQNPTTCGGALKVTADTTAYDLGTDHAEAPIPATTGCDQLSFEPSLSAKPTSAEADSPSGLDVNLTVPQPQNPTTPSPSQIRATTVTLPPGFTINPNAADGKTSCTDEQAKFGSRDQAECPEFAKVGTLEVESSSLPGALPGAIYLGEPLSGNRYRVFLVADGFSLHIKLPGTVTPDPVTGQLEVSFQDLPPAPFQRFDMHFFGAERGLLATPTQCGTYAVNSTFTPWASQLPDQTSTQFFTIDSGPGGTPCPASARPFAPSLTAGVADNTGGTHSPFSLLLGREDGDQNLAALNVTTPPGFTATLKGVPYCPQAAIDRLQSAGYSGRSELASPTCPPASQIGRAVAGAGAGSQPLYVGGKVYLAGPYRGAPLSLIAVIPAVSGPYDLGVVAVRAAISVDPKTAQVTTSSDPLPQILEGIPLRARSVRVDLDRPDFALNPTNCDPFSVDTAVFANQGARANLRSHFQVANCADLDFSPKLSLGLRGSIKRRGNPALRAVLVAGPGEANLSRTVVAMPETLQLDNAHVGSICTRVQFAANACPQRSLVGSATAQSPLLDEPLSGPVYLRSSSHELPDLVVALKGQFDIELVGRIDTTKDDALRTSFEGIPDAPVSKFTLNLLGGSKGLLINSENLCKSKPQATVAMEGQNGLALKRRTALGRACGKAMKQKKRQEPLRAGKAG